MIDNFNYKIGAKVIVHDPVDLKRTTVAQIAYIEQDNEYNILWLYLINLDSSLANNKPDPKFNFLYWEVLENSNEYIRLVNTDDSLVQ